jgi:hypothetical protein
VRLRIIFVKPIAANTASGKPVKSGLVPLGKRE